MIDQRRSRVRRDPNSEIQLGFGVHEQSKELPTPNIQILTPRPESIQPEYQYRRCPNCKEILDWRPHSKTWLCVNEGIPINPLTGQSTLQEDYKTEMKVPAELQKDPYATDDNKPIFISVDRESKEPDYEVTWSSADSRIQHVRMKDGLRDYNIREELEKDKRRNNNVNDR